MSDKIVRRINFESSLEIPKEMCEALGILDGRAFFVERVGNTLVFTKVAETPEHSRFLESESVRETITGEQIADLFSATHKENVTKLVRGKSAWSALDILKLDMLAELKLHIVRRGSLVRESVLHEFACRCAEMALKAVDSDPVIIEAVAIKRAWISGEITTAQLEDTLATLNQKAAGFSNGILLGVLEFDAYESVRRTSLTTAQTITSWTVWHEKQSKNLQARRARQRDVKAKVYAEQIELLRELLEQSEAAS